MASTTTEFGLEKSREYRNSRPPNGDRASSRASAPRRPPAALVPNPLEEPAAGEGAPGRAGRRGSDPPFGAPAPEAMLLLRASVSSRPERSSRASISAEAAAAKVLSASKITVTAGGSRKPQAALDAAFSSVPTASATMRSRAKEA